MKKKITIYFPLIPGKFTFEKLKATIKMLTLRGVINGYKEFVSIDEENESAVIMKIRYIKENNTFSIR